MFNFFFNDTATTEIYTLSLHDALPISGDGVARRAAGRDAALHGQVRHRRHQDRKSTRLNSSHQIISYAVFCLKKKNKANSTPLHSHHTTIRTNPTPHHFIPPHHTYTIT